MVGQLSNFIGNNVPQAQQAPVRHAAPTIKAGNPNPFNGNPFVASKTVENAQTFGKNMPVPGGFFAGYHNGQPNIVGAKLFVEI